MEINLFITIPGVQKVFSCRSCIQPGRAIHLLSGEKLKKSRTRAQSDCHSRLALDLRAVAGRSPPSQGKTNHLFNMFETRRVQKHVKKD